MVRFLVPIIVSYSLMLDNQINDSGFGDNSQMMEVISIANIEEVETNRPGSTATRC